MAYAGDRINPIPWISDIEKTYIISAMDLKQIRSFLVVAELRSVSRAVDVLGISQPSISRQIQLLESELRQHLLTRTGRGVELTEAGRQFLVHAREIDRMAHQAVQTMWAFSGNPLSRVRLGMPHRIARRMTHVIMRHFQERLPDTALTVAEGLSSEMTDWLLKGRVDVALLYEPPPSTLIQVETVHREDLVLVYQPGRHRMPERMRVSSLANQSFVLPSMPNTIRALVNEAFAEAGVTLNVATEVDVVQTILETISQTELLTILPRSALTDLRGGQTLAFSELCEPTIRNRLCLALPVQTQGLKTLQEVTKLIRSLDIASLMQ
ncbi:LysR family nitrogen assimilation transcriptional regulator [Paracandidimonas soli]|uniref:LysR family nitrogen assimilation transcriptional regulator n=2 Tax=Paracandidimonas soli TaxID=1917182 RepID=A0A4R3UUC3_9BURK|nr:LysR family nitrogen assimilation transcriptional regulator [Paracandidimonas soli]